MKKKCAPQQIPTDLIVAVLKAVSEFRVREALTALHHRVLELKSPVRSRCCSLLVFCPFCLPKLRYSVLRSATLPDLQLLPPYVFLLSSPLLLLRKNLVAITKQVFVLEILLNFHFGIYFIKHITCYLEAYAPLCMFSQLYASTFTPE